MVLLVVVVPLWAPSTPGGTYGTNKKRTRHFKLLLLLNFLFVCGKNPPVSLLRSKVLYYIPTHYYYYITHVHTISFPLHPTLLTKISEVVL